jgi:hypothetical protein
MKAPSEEEGGIIAQLSNLVNRKSRERDYIQKIKGNHFDNEAWRKGASGGACQDFADTAIPIMKMRHRSMKESLSTDAMCRSRAMRSRLAQCSVEEREEKFRRTSSS